MGLVTAVKVGYPTFIAFAIALDASKEYSGLSKFPSKLAIAIVVAFIVRFLGFFFEDEIKYIAIKSRRFFDEKFKKNRNK